MNKRNSLLFTIIVLQWLPQVFAEQRQGVEGRFFRISKSDLEFYVDGERYEFKEGKTKDCRVSDGSVVVVKYRSRFVYNAALFAFKYQDKSHWIPITRSGVKVLDNAVDPKEVTVEMIENSTRSAPRGRLGKPFAANWLNYGLPAVPSEDWFGVLARNEWCLCMAL